MTAARVRTALIALSLSLLQAACGKHVENNSSCDSTSCATGESCIAGSCAPSITQAGPPTGVTASANGLSAEVSWSAPADNGGAAITGYVVTTSPGGGATNSADTNVNVPSLSSGTTYRFTVHAVTSFGAGVESAPSAPLLIGTAGYRFTAPQSVSAGAPFLVTVSALDGSGSVDASDSSTLALTSSDPLAAPAMIPLVNGSAQFDFTLFTAPSQTLTATSAIASTTSSPIEVLAPSRIALTGPSDFIYATAGELTLTVLDQDGNPATNYAGGTFVLSTPAAGVAMPASVAIDAGSSSAQLSVTISAVESQIVITATDASGTLGSAALTIQTVEPLPASHFLFLTSCELPQAGISCTYTVTPEDSYNNIDTNYAGRVAITSSDATAVSSTDHLDFAPVAADAPDAMQFTFTFHQIGAQNVQVFDGNVAAALDLQVSSGPVAQYLIDSDFSSTSPAGSSSTLVIEAHDSSGNLITPMSQDEQLSFTASDPGVTPPPSGTYTFYYGYISPSQTIVLRKAGLSTLTVTDAQGNSGVLSTSVTPGIATGFQTSGVSSTIAAGAPVLATLEAVDLYGNIATGFNGPVPIDSSDPQSAGPISITFASGVATLSSAAPQLQFQTAGAQTFTIEAPGYPNAVSPSIAVTAGAPESVVLSGFPVSPVPTGTYISFTASVADAFGNPVSGSFSLTSTDPGASFTDPTYIFSSSDLGMHQFIDAVAFSQGSASVTVTGTLSNSQGSASGTGEVTTE